MFAPLTNVGIYIKKLNLNFKIEKRNHFVEKNKIIYIFHDFLYKRQKDLTETNIEGLRECS